MYVRMTKAFEFKNERGEKVTAPRGWIGDLPDAVAARAIKEGRAVDGAPRSLASTLEPAADDLDDKTKADLEALAKERGLDVSAARTKADLIEALRKA